MHLDDLVILEIGGATEDRDTAWPDRLCDRKHECGCRERKCEKEEQHYMRNNWPGVAYCQASHA